MGKDRIGAHQKSRRERGNLLGVREERMYFGKDREKNPKEACSSRAFHANQNTTTTNPNNVAFPLTLICSGPPLSLSKKNHSQKWLNITLPHGPPLSFILIHAFVPFASSYVPAGIILLA